MHVNFAVPLTDGLVPGTTWTGTVAVIVTSPAALQDAVPSIVMPATLVLENVHLRPSEGSNGRDVW